MYKPALLFVLSLVVFASDLSVEAEFNGGVEARLPSSINIRITIPEFGYYEIHNNLRSQYTMKQFNIPQTKDGLSTGYGLLGAYQGIIFGSLLGVSVLIEGNPGLGCYGISIGALLGASSLGYAGNYLGARANSKWEKGIVIGGAAIATGLLAFTVWFLYTLEDIGS